MFLFLPIFVMKFKAITTNIYYQERFLIDNDRSTYFFAPEEFGAKLCLLSHGCKAVGHCA